MIEDLEPPSFDFGRDREERTREREREQSFLPDPDDLLDFEAPEEEIRLEPPEPERSHWQRFVPDMSETPELKEEGVRMRFIGRRQGVGPALLEQMDWAQAETAHNDRITLYVAFNYGARAEILDAAERYTGGGEEAFRELLYAPEMHDPDLLIRTSGEQRISNYLLWQLAYSELMFVDELWPDFSREAFRAALDEYEGRRRRFGGR